MSDYKALYEAAETNIRILGTELQAATENIQILSTALKRCEEERKCAVENFSATNKAYVEMDERWRASKAELHQCNSEWNERYQRMMESAADPLAVLTPRDLLLCEAVSTWIRTVRGSKFGYDNAWLPSRVDFEKSRLFWRLRLGRAPLPEPPPTCFSCPWYEVVENAGPHDCYEVWFPEDDARSVIINQCRYRLETKVEEAELYLVSFGTIRFQIWQDLEKTMSGWIWDPETTEETRAAIRAEARKNRSRGWWIERYDRILNSPATSRGTQGEAQ